MNSQNILKRNKIDSLLDAVKTACDRIPPSWPLDQSIAVNPWWNWRDMNIKNVSASLKAINDIDLLMPKSYYRELLEKQIKPEHIVKAMNELNSESSFEDLLAFLQESDSQINGKWLHIGDLLDNDPSRSNKMPWHDEIVHQISQFCALYFQYPEQMVTCSSQVLGLYQGWLDVLSGDKGISTLMDEPEFYLQFANLPDSLEHAFDSFSQEFLDFPFSEEDLTEYVYSLLVDVYGWATWIAYKVWQSTLNGISSELLLELAAIRLTWELILLRHIKSKSKEQYEKLKRLVMDQFEIYHVSKRQCKEYQSKLWIFQRALEYSYQEEIQKKLVSSYKIPIDRPSLQAVFCIDVRSEPIRRALESQDPGIQTYGFAGFFGLPIAYSENGSTESTPQLPGLFKPSLIVKPNKRENDSFLKRFKWKRIAESAPSAFGFVESFGIFKSISLFKASEVSSSRSFENVTWDILREGRQLDFKEMAELAYGILQSIGFRQSWSKYVLLVGHGSQSSNNPHSSSLDCGACGGQSGEINARVLAQILNHRSVRRELDLLNYSIPDETVFVSALHNTTTDQITVFEDVIPKEIQSWLDSAKQLAQTKRASQFELNSSSGKKLNQLFIRRSKDWAQLRPEWGLANNASLIIGPRYLTKDIDLDGRSFLHDYDSMFDSDATGLEKIMTAPMIVTNWINLQYYASVTDNQMYGSGNKMLHNVVANHIGVFEGNGGDLRVGLPLQSIHDGRSWRHQPIRLSVYISAPLETISSIIKKHQTLKLLIENEWIFIIQYEHKQNTFMQYKPSGWVHI